MPLHASVPRPGCGSQAGKVGTCLPTGEKVSPYLGKERQVCISTSDPAKRKPSALYYGLASCVVYLASLTFPFNMLKFISCPETKKTVTQLQSYLVCPWHSSKVLGRNSHIKTTSAFAIKLVEATVSLLSCK